MKYDLKVFNTYPLIKKKEFIFIFLSNIILYIKTIDFYPAIKLNNKLIKKKKKKNAF